MAAQVIMPRVGISVESCIVTKWHKQKGERVQAGDVLFSYETDKATADEEAKSSGVLLEILAREGDEVPVLQTVCIIGEPDEDISGLLAASETQPVVEQPKVESAAPVPAISQEPAAGPPNVSPRARHLAQKAGIALPGGGSGPEGRIVERDVRAAMDARAGTGLGGRIRDQEAGTRDQGRTGAEIVRLSSVRKAIAKSMAQSLSSIAQLTNHHSFDASAILQCRAKLKAEADAALAGITLNDIVLYAVAKTLQNHRDLNAHLIDGHMHYFDGVHLGIAVDTPRGLLVPTLFEADKLSLPALSMAAKRLIKEARAGTISPGLLQGGTFTVTNLGTLGVEQFTPVINPPQTGILGVCAIVDRVRIIDRGIAAYPAMGLSLTYDHRAVDGAPAARFVMELKELLENWSDDGTL